MGVIEVCYMLLAFESVQLTDRLSHLLPGSPARCCSRTRRMVLHPLPLVPRRRFRFRRRRRALARFVRGSRSGILGSMVAQVSGAETCTRWRSEWDTCDACPGGRGRVDGRFKVSLGSAFTFRVYVERPQPGRCRSATDVSEKGSRGPTASALETDEKGHRERGRCGDRVLEIDRESV